MSSIIIYIIYVHVVSTVYFKYGMKYMYKHKSVKQSANLLKMIMNRWD